VRLRVWLLAGLTLALPAVLAGTELTDWIWNAEARSRLEAVFYRVVPMPGAQVPARRPPAETGSALTELIREAPGDAQLYALRAFQAERQLDFTAAEADWKQHAGLAADRAAGQLALADFYHRRLRPHEEALALVAAVQAMSPTHDRLLPAEEQLAWRTFERLFALIEAQALSALAQTAYRVWLARYPRQSAVYEKYFDFLLEQEQYTAADQFVSTFQQAFPTDTVFVVRARARIARRRGSVAEALGVYSRSFEPLWPPALVQSWFELLKETRQLRAFLDKARVQVATAPDDLVAACRIFYYYQQRGDLAAAQLVLMDFRQRKESAASPWTAEELFTLGRLFEGVHNYDAAARYYYSLYSLPDADESDGERGLAGLAGLLLTAPEQPISFGSDDLSFYRDVATMDTGPGFLNGVLSLLFNSASPAQKYAEQERSAVAYFHRARAAELLALLDQRFPQSKQRPALHARLLQAYALYGADDGVIKGGETFLSDFPEAPQRTEVALLVAEAFARTDRVAEELAVYDRLLAELGARADGVPLGFTLAPERGRRRRGRTVSVRSPEYARVLDRYIARLVSLKRVLEAMQVYRGELDRYPDDPGLYERLAAFLEQNHLGDEVERVYRRAMGHFDDRSWHHRLARWYLRGKRRAEFGQLTRSVVDVFSGTELEAYFSQVVTRDPLDPQLYLQLNLYAHRRFPHNLSFVRNLLGAYRRPETRDQAAWEQLLRQHWYYANDLRREFFRFLSRTKRLKAELQAVRPSSAPADEGRWPERIGANPAAVFFVAEGEIWRSHFEEAAPVLHALAATYPAEADLARRAAAVHRSLSPLESDYTGRAVEIETNLNRFDPRDPATLTRLGEILADRERFEEARPYWDRLAEIEPGRPGGYLEAATVFWDYFQFDDALRLLAEGRLKLGNPALFAYEAGAIYENRREHSRAVAEYVAGALATPPNMAARQRLLVLARRRSLRKEIEAATTAAVAGNDPTLAAVSLRTAVLDTQQRRDDLEALLLRLVQGTTSWELLEEIDRIAERKGFDVVQARSLERQIALTEDPVERLRLRLVQVQRHEGRKEFDQARQRLEELYRENPRLLGIVRATVDYHWRRDLREPAIAILLEAAQASYPTLERQFLFEAARKSTEARNYAQARQLLEQLLENEPFRADYLAAMADTYAREGDQAGLRDYYLETIELLKEAPLGREARTTRIAGLRRGLIPALTHLGDYTGGVDQYIEIINRYPEDESLVSEAAFYADRHGLRDRLIRYYARTADESPKDFRWPLVLARLETHFERLPGAIAAYHRAARVRPDRTDLHVARAALEERLLLFDDALHTYEELYELTFGDPRWMEKAAEQHLRQGRANEAVAALQTALIEGRPERPEILFTLARRLERWGLLEQARTFAERGVELAADELLTDRRLAPGTGGYARLLTRLGDYATAHERLRQARQGLPPARTRARFAPALTQMGQAVKRYFTPEQKQLFARYLIETSAGRSRDELAEELIPLAQSAGLAEIEARWRYQVMTAWAGQERAKPHERRFQELQERRGKFAELGRQLEAYWRIYPAKPDKGRHLRAAAGAYQTAGLRADELRCLQTLHSRRSLSGQLLARYFELLWEDDPAKVISIADADARERVRNAAANFAVAQGDQEHALAAVTARGRGLPPVWTPIHQALVGLYYTSPKPVVQDAFEQALGPAPIGTRLGKSVDREQQLAGDIWFYYGGRYGEYLDVTRLEDPHAYLPAELEQTPTRVGAYLALADYFGEKNDFERAVEDYDHALQLDRNRGEAHSRAAGLLWGAGREEEAVERWRAALQAFTRVQDSGRVPESFWSEVQRTLELIGERQQLPLLRSEADRLLRTYVRRNGYYRVEPLLRGALAAAGESDGADWIADLSQVAPDPVGFLSQIANAEWLPTEQRQPLLRALLDAAQRRVNETHGTARSYAEQTLHEWQVRWIEFLMDGRRSADAEAALVALPEETRRRHSHRVAVLELRLAARAGRLNALLTDYERKPETAASAEPLRRAAQWMREEGNHGAARQALEFLYRRELENHNLRPANFLGLAEIRLEENDLEGGVALLRRMTRVAGQPFETLEAAADLLEKAGYPAAAATFQAEKVQTAPWEAAARVRLAELLLAAGSQNEKAGHLLAAAVTNSANPYKMRTQAARSPGVSGGFRLGSNSAELELLAAGGTIEPNAAQQPFFYQARVEAAAAATEVDEKLQLLLGALALEPQADAVRPALLHAAVGAGQPQLAVAVVEPLFENTALVGLLKRRAPLETQDENREERLAETFLVRRGMESRERAEAARSLAAAYQWLNRPGAEELLLRIALRLEESAGQRETLSQRIEQLAAERRVRTENASRRPVISEKLEQEGVVRPRLRGAARSAGGAGR
jgi:Tfp pilus assembly protein PilF